MMPVELLALGAAFSYAGAQTIIKVATRSGSMMLGFLITLVTGNIALGVLAVMTVDTWAVPVGPFALFALAGLAGPGVGRLLAMRSVRDVGATVAVPVQASSNPLLASLAGVIVFNETVGAGRVLALALIVSGIWSCVRGGSANREASVDPGGTGKLGLARFHVLFLPLSAGAAYAGTDVLRKAALAGHGDPVLGAFIGILTALIVWLIIFLVIPQFREPVRVTRSFGWFCLSGVFSAAAQIFLLSALLIGDISVIAPIVASQPVIVIILSAVLLRDLEKLRIGTVVGATLVAVGVAYLSLA